MLIQATYGRWCCELEKPLSVYLQRQSKKSIFHNVQLTLQKSNIYFVQRKPFSYRKSSYFKHSATNKEFLEEHPEKNRSQVRFVSISGRSGGQASCTDGLKSIQQEPSFQALWTQHHAQSIAEVSSVLVQNRFGDPLCRLQPQMTGIEIEKESVIPSRRTLQNLSRKQDELCIFGQMRIK